MGQLFAEEHGVEQNFIHRSMGLDGRRRGTGVRCPGGLGEGMVDGLAEALSDGSSRDVADATHSALAEGLGSVKVIVENTFVKAYTWHGDSESLPTHRTT